MSITVLVVDDSALMRKYIRKILEKGGMHVVTARNGKEALTQIPSLQPDVVTLDINMPEMDGLTCLSHIMTECPCSVLMVSSLTSEGALATFEALELGAVDFIPKPDGTVSRNIKQISEELIAKVRAVARTRSRSLRRKNQATPSKHQYTQKRREDSSFLKWSSDQRMKLVLIGSSTGGPRALETVLSGLPVDFPYPIMVAQHMPGKFTQVFSQRLAGICSLNVQEVTSSVALTPGYIFIGRGDADLIVSRRGGRRVALCVPEDSDYLWHPSVQKMVLSALNFFSPTDLIGVLLTGMGYDGAHGMAEIYRQGGLTIAESADSAVVFGMPQELIKLNGAKKILNIENVTEQLIEWSFSSIGAIRQ